MNHDRAGLKPLLQCRQGKSLKETLVLNMSLIQTLWFQLLFCAVNYRVLCALAYRAYWPRGVQEDLGCSGLVAAHDLILHSSRKGKSYEQHHLHRRPGCCHHRGLGVFWTALKLTEGFRKAIRKSSRTRRSPSGHRKDAGVPCVARSKKSSACRCRRMALCEQAMPRARYSLASCYAFP